MVSQDPLLAEPDAPRRQQRSISDSRKLVENAAQQLARLRQEKLLRQALLSAAELPLPPEAGAAREIDGKSDAIAAQQSLTSRSSEPREESSATAWASARSTSQPYRDARSIADGGSGSDDDEQTSALTPLRPDQQEAARAAGLSACAPPASERASVTAAEDCDLDENEWSPGAGLVAPLDADPPRQLKRITKGNACRVATAPEQGYQTGTEAIALEDSSDDDWQAAVSNGISVSEPRKPLRRLQKAGSRAHASKVTAAEELVDLDLADGDDVAEALGAAMANLTVRLGQIVELRRCFGDQLAVPVVSLALNKK